MSGGVDSAASAILLKNAGYEVIGATMKLWEDTCQDTAQCSSFRAMQDARQLCDTLGIKHEVFDCSLSFQQHVIRDFIDCYENGMTPNPCVECNKYLKFGEFYKIALDLGCEYLATGHYAKIEYSQKYNTYVLKKAAAEKKDQSYFLYQIKKEIIPKIIFPLQDYQTKQEVRKILEPYQLPIAHKKDSQEICFIPNNNYGEFLSCHGKTKSKKGNIVLEDGTVIGTHEGLIYYTIGQRKGLGIAYQEPLYVLKLDKTKNELVVGTQERLYVKELYARDLNFLLDLDLSKPILVEAKVRYRAQPAKAMIFIQKDMAKVVFEEPQRAVTPGQSVVFYLDDVLLGGGKIVAIESKK